MSHARSSRSSADDIDTTPTFVDFEEDGEEGGFSGYEDEETFSPYPGSMGPGSEPVEENPTENLADALLELTWIDPAYSSTLWGYDVRRQARATPDVKLAVKHILGVPVGEAAAEKVAAYGRSLVDSELLEQIVKFRVDPALMQGALENPYASEETLLHIERSGITDESGSLESALVAFSLVHEVLAGNESVSAAARSLVEGKNAVAISLLEGQEGFDSILSLLAAKEHTSLRKAVISLSSDPDGLTERYLDHTDLKCEEVDLDTLWWLSRQDDLSFMKAMVFSDEPSELSQSVAERMDEQAAWWCALSHDPAVRALAAQNPTIRRFTRWHTRADSQVRRPHVPVKPFNPSEFKNRIGAMLLSGVSEESISNMVCREAGIPEEEAVAFVPLGYANTVVEWLSGATKVPVRPGFIRRVMDELSSAKRDEVLAIIRGMRPDLARDYPWSMELFLTTPGASEAVTAEQAVWAQAYIEHAISECETKGEVLESILTKAPTWSGSIVELVEGEYPQAKGIPTVGEPEDGSYY